MASETNGPCPGDARDRARGNGSSPRGEERPLSEAAARLRAQTSELYEYLSYLASTRVDSYKVTARKAAIGAALGVLGGFAAAGAAVTLTAVTMLFLLRGAAGGLGALFGREWLGELCLGALFFGAAGGLGVYYWKRFQKSTRESLEKKYGNRKVLERVEFGRSVDDRAREAAHGE